MEEMLSITRRLINTIYDSLEDDRVYNLAEFKKIIYEKTGMQYGKEYQESHFAGATKVLREENRIEKCGWGLYRKRNAKAYEQVVEPSIDESVEENQYDTSLKNEILASVKKEITYLHSRTDNLQIPFSEASKEEFDNISRIKELIAYLEQFELI